MKEKQFRFAMLAAVLATSLVSSTAGASGFLVARFGGEQGHPTTSNLSAIYFNPAGLALTGGTRVYVEGLFAMRSATYVRPASAIDNTGTGTPDDAVSANAGTATLSNRAAAPFIAVASDFGVKNLGVAAGLYVPFGGSAEWDKNSAYVGSTVYPGAEDGVARWSSINGSAKSIYATLAGAYRFPKQRISVGVGLNLVMTSVNTLRARNTDGTDDLVSSVGGLQEGRGLVNVSNKSMSFSAGVIWEPIEKLWLGASYQARPGFRALQLKGTLDSKLGVSPSSQSEISLRWSLPDVARLGARYRPSDKIELRVFGEFVRWSVLDDHCGINAAEADKGCKLDARGNSRADGAAVLFNVPREWNNAFGVRAGGSYWLQSALELFGGLGFDSNAVPDKTLDPGLMDMNKMSFSIGARYEVLPGRLQILATATQVVYFDRSLEPRPQDGSGNPIAPFDPPSRAPDFAGDYSQSVSVLNLGLEYMF